MSNESAVLNASLTVNELIAREPGTIDVFNRFGIDTCCGSQVSITEAARRDGVDLDRLLADLHQALGST